MMGATRAAEMAVAVRSCVASLIPPGNMASRWLFVQKAATNELMPAPFDEARAAAGVLARLRPRCLWHLQVICRRRAGGRSA